MLFGATAGWVALAPLYLYVSGLVEATLKDNALVFLLGALATALVLFYVYDVLAAKTRLALIKNRYPSLPHANRLMLTCSP